MQPTGISGARTQIWSVGIAAAWMAACSSPVCAQTIQPDDQPAVTIDNFADAPRSQAPRTQGPIFFGDAFTSLERNSNALSLSNLPGGLELPAVADTVWLKGVSVGLGYQVSDSATLFVRAEAAHTSFFENSFLSFAQFTGSAGVNLRVSKRLSLLGAVSCTSQRDGDSFREYYNYCAPIGVVSAFTGDPWSGSGTRWSAHVIAPRGKAIDLARYVQVGGGFSYEGGSKFRISLGPRGYVRWYDTAEEIALGQGNRRDYQGTFRLAAAWHTGRLEIGIAAEPTANWSTDANYRFWDVRGGPFLRWRFGS